MTFSNPGASGGGWRALTPLLVSIASAGIIAWVAAGQATRDYAIRDQEHASFQDRRIDDLELAQQRTLDYLQRIDSRLARIEGKLGVP